MKKQHITLGIYALTFIFLVCIPLTRMFMGLPLSYGSESYYHMGISENLKGDFFLDSDPLTDAPYKTHPYHLLLALTGNFFDMEVSGIALGIFFGMIFIFIFAQILKKIKSVESHFILLSILKC